MLRLITAWSSDSLADWLASWYAAPTGDPFSRELVVVPTPGMEKYLTRRLARRLGSSATRSADGVCAGVDFVQPGDLLHAVISSSLPDDDPWTPDALQWHCLTAIDELLDEGDDPAAAAAWSVGLRHYLRPERRDARRMSLAREVAGLFNNYAVQRPALLTAWAEGDASQTPARFTWQYRIFRHVLDSTGAAPWPLRVGELLDKGLAGGTDQPSDGPGDRGVGGPTPVALPSRIAVFGVTRYGQLERQLIEALSRNREVAILMVDHCPAAAPGRRGPANPLVEWFAGEERSCLHMLEAMTPQRERLESGPGTGPGLLHRLQRAIAQDRPLGVDESAPEVPAASGSGSYSRSAPDTSLTVHGCAGALRQVEVLRDQVLHLLQSDESLEPRDIVVMCSKLEVFAPLIAQVFGTDSAPIDGPTRNLRTRIADRVQRLDNPVLQVIETFLAVAGSRVSRTDVLSLLELPAVSQGFELESDDHERLDVLTSAACIRWGLSPEHRKDFGIPVEDVNTWRAGLDRLAVGVAADGRNVGLIHGVAPTEAAGDGDVRLVAVLDSVIETIASAWEFSRSPRPARQWAARIAEWSQALVKTADPWQLAAAVELVSAALTGDQQLSVREVAAVLGDELAQFARQPDLLVGGVAVAAMRPMRNIPFRVVCMVGMDDGAFPRAAALGGNDVLAVVPQAGERDPRAEDRQLFLDAICAAEQHLVITYTSRDPRSGDRLPPAAPLAELLDSVGDIAQEHPLTAHDPANFLAGSPGSTATPGFDAAAAMIASTEPTRGEQLRDLLLEPMHGDVTLDDLLTFWDNPGKVFLGHLGLAMDRDDEADDDEIPLELGGLAGWAIGDALLRSGRPLPLAAAVEAARGSLPAAGATQAWASIESRVATLRDQVARHDAGPIAPVAVDIDLGAEGSHVRQGRLTGLVAVSGGGGEGSVILDAGYGSEKAKHRLNMRIRVAALAAMGRPAPGVLIRRDKDSAAVKTFQPPNREAALVFLRFMARLRWRGLTQPLPYSSETSCAFASVTDEKKRLDKARDKWNRSFNGYGGEGEDPQNRVLWGGDLDVMMSVPPWPEWRVPGSQESLFAQIALYLFEGSS